jgi:hypothetical protein
MSPVMSKVSPSRSSFSDEVKEDLAIIDNEKTHQKRSWLRRLNPFSWDDLPPVPKSDAGLVPEIQANWLSKLTWGWISPLMLVHTYLYFSFVLKYG